MEGRPSHRLVRQGLTVLERLAHRGASGAEVGDGGRGRDPHPGPTPVLRNRGCRPRHRAAEPRGLRRRRRVPADRRRRCREGSGPDRGLGRRGVPPGARLARGARRKRDARHDRQAGQARIEQVFVGWRERQHKSALELERLAFIVRKRVEHDVDGVYFASLSSRTFVYKGMLTATSSAASSRPRRPARRERPGARALALLDEHLPVLAARSPVPLHRPQRRDQHHRRATATGCGPGRRCSRASSFRAICSGSSRRAPPAPATRPRFDEVLELFHLGGRSLAPRGADDDPRGLGEPRRHGPRPGAPSTGTTPALMEPWDGPAAVAFTDGHGHRRGARPQRPAPGPVLGDRRRPRRAGLRGRGARHRPEHDRAQGPAPAGPACSSSTPAAGRIVDDAEIKAELAAEHPYASG